MPIVRWASTPGASSRARSLRTCRWCRRASSSWSSTPDRQDARHNCAVLAARHRRRGDRVKRREFITLLGGAIIAWPLAARAQQQMMSVIGLLNGQATTSLIPAFRQGLSEAGFDEGRNVAIVYRSAEGEVERLRVLADELVRLRVGVIAAVGGTNSVLAAKAATTTIPIVFTSGVDPVEAGVIASLSRPGGNVTGATFLSSMAASKQLGLLRD